MAWYIYVMMTDTKKIPLGPLLVVMVGPSGAGKSTFIEKHFEPREVVSTDAIREELTGDFERQDKNDQVFDQFYARIRGKLQAGQRVVADATHIKNADRRRTAQIGVDLGLPVYYVVVNRSVESKMQTGGWRNKVRIGDTSLIQKHDTTFEANLTAILQGDGLADEVVDTRQGRDQYEVVQPLSRNGPTMLNQLVDRGYEYIRVIGDVHGNLSGLKTALNGVDDRGVTFFLFLGDIMDYGVDTLQTTSMVSRMVRAGEAACIRGNHERKVYNFVVQERGDGFRGQETHGNAITFNQIKALTPKRRTEWEYDMISLVENSPDWIQIGNWLFTHGAADPKMWDNPLFRAHRNSKLESYALYGETDGTKGNDGFPNRTYGWVNEIPSGKTVVVGHAIHSVDEPVVKWSDRSSGKAIMLDTGSSKDLDGKPGKLSWMDLKIARNRTGFMSLTWDDEFGSE